MTSGVVIYSYKTDLCLDQQHIIATWRSVQLIYLN